MFQRKLSKLWMLTLGCLLLTMVTGVIRADSSHTVSVKIDEICRYRIVSMTTLQVNPNDQIQEVTMAISSNSHRTWRLAAIPERTTQTTEWSEDGRNWQTFDESETIFTGTKTPWTNYHFYVRNQGNSVSEGNDPVHVKFYILYEE